MSSRRSGDLSGISGGATPYSRCLHHGFLNAAPLTSSRTKTSRDHLILGYIVFDAVVPRRCILPTYPLGSHGWLATVRYTPPHKELVVPPRSYQIRRIRHGCRSSYQLVLLCICRKVEHIHPTLASSEGSRGQKPKSIRSAAFSGHQLGCSSPSADGTTMKSCFLLCLTGCLVSLVQAVHFPFETVQLTDDDVEDF